MAAIPPNNNRNNGREEEKGALKHFCRHCRLTVNVRTPRTTICPLCHNGLFESGRSRRYATPPLGQRRMDLANLFRSSRSPGTLASSLFGLEEAPRAAAAAAAAGAGGDADANQVDNQAPNENGPAAEPNERHENAAGTGDGAADATDGSGDGNGEPENEPNADADDADTDDADADADANGNAVAADAGAARCRPHVAGNGAAAGGSANETGRLGEQLRSTVRTEIARLSNELRNNGGGGGGGGGEFNGRDFLRRLYGTAGQRLRQELVPTIPVIIPTNPSGPPPMTEEEMDRIPILDITSNPVPNDVLCAVCWDKFIGAELVIRKLECSHIYHDNCIRPWLALRGNCPICRHDLVHRPSEPSFRMRYVRRGFVPSLSRRRLPIFTRDWDINSINGGSPDRGANGRHSATRRNIVNGNGIISSSALANSVVGDNASGMNASGSSSDSLNADRPSGSGDARLMAASSSSVLGGHTGGSTLADIHNNPIGGNALDSVREENESVGDGTSEEPITNGHGSNGGVSDRLVRLHSRVGYPWPLDVPFIYSNDSDSDEDEYVYETDSDFSDNETGIVHIATVNTQNNATANANANDDDNNSTIDNTADNDADIINNNNNETTNNDDTDTTANGEAPGEPNDA